LAFRIGCLTVLENAGSPGTVTVKPPSSGSGSTTIEYVRTAQPLQKTTELFETDSGRIDDQNRSEMKKRLRRTALKVIACARKISFGGKDAQAIDLRDPVRS